MRSTMLAMVSVLFIGCPAEQKSEPAPRRFAAVKRTAKTARASKIFCEKAYSAGERKWDAPPEQPAPSFAAKDEDGEGWRWINFWASWCGPCLEEMPLLQRWQKALAADGSDLRFELWSVDEERAPFERTLRMNRSFPPGGVHWLRSSDDLETLFGALGIGNDSAIPIHALVDPKGDLRCVRVGAVTEGDYGTIKSILAGN